MFTTPLLMPIGDIMKVNYGFYERFNNYFNRKLIKYTDTTDYENHSKNSFYPRNSSDTDFALFDFTPNDNITTEIIVNDVPFDPDYFLTLDPEDNSILQRWFVLEQKRNRQGQWVYTLRRDVLADSLDEILNSPVYVEKGIINDLNSPLLMNNEDLRVNQIKKKEILLKDRTDSAWLVLYLKKGVLGNRTLSNVGNGDGTININVTRNDVDVYEELSTPIASWQYAPYVSQDYKINNGTQFNVLFHCFYFGFFGCDYQVSNLSNYPSSLGAQLKLALPSDLWSDPQNPADVKAKLDPVFRVEATMNSLVSKVNSAFSLNSSNPLLQYNDKIIKDSDGKYYKISVQMVSNETLDKWITDDNALTLKNQLIGLWNTANNQTDTSHNDNCFKALISVGNWRISYTELTSLGTVVDFGAYTGMGTVDSALYDVICMPYGKVNVVAQGGLMNITTSKERSLAVMNGLAKAFTSNYALDLQLLPYFPMQSLIDKSIRGKIGIKYLNDTSIYGVENSDYSDAIFVCENSNFTFDIDQSVRISDSSDVPAVYKKKYLNDCTTVRLCSPNYNGLFEMNLAKNGGQIRAFNVDITLKPYNPYIHLNPDFNFLYGEDFNDNRGLICSGDFSLGIINDAWNNYEIQNKNYQAIFDRQIQNLDINNAINMSEATWGAIAGTVTGGASGAMAGGMVGGGWGALAGGILGTGVSAIGGVMDVEHLKARQREAKSYAMDNFNLSLGNIRALPYSITKTDALTYNNKLFPFVEIYECSEVEKQAYYNKIKYNGMSVRIIDQIDKYYSGSASQFFRGRLIRSDAIAEDSHYLQAVNAELMEGVFI